jgi:hypothetical protein
LFSVSTFVQQHPSDIVACDYYEWNSKTNHKKRAHTIWAYKNKHYSSLTKKIWKLKTPYSLPIVKFYRNIVFKRSQDLEEGIPYQDQNLYYQCLYLSSSYGYIHLPLGFWRNDRSDSSTNMPWNKSKVDAWVNFIKTTANFDAKMNAYFFLTVKQFAKAYQQYYQEPFALNGKLKKCYILKCFVPLAHLFVFYLRIKYRKIVVFKSK